MLKLILFVGVPGSGKTTFYEKHPELFPKGHVYVSLDRFRKLVINQDYLASFEPFVRCWIDSTRLYLIDQGVDIVFDATNITRALRSSWIKAAKAKGYKIDCYFFDVSWLDLIRRDALREKKVGIDVLKRMTEFFEEPTLEEGFDNLKRIHEDLS